MLTKAEIQKRNISQHSNPGNRYKVQKHGEVLPDGTIRLVMDDVIDLQEHYNAQKEATSIENILAMADPGKSFADDGTGGFDATQVPKTLAEFLQFQIDAKRSFEQLPAEIRAKFHNDLTKYMATAGSEEWMQKLGIEYKKDTDIPVEPVKEEPKEVDTSK